MAKAYQTIERFGFTEAIAQSIRGDYPHPPQIRPVCLRPDVLRIAFVGTFPPTACGIATFTRSLRDAMIDENPRIETGVIRLVDEPSSSTPPGIATDWVRNEPAATRSAAATAGSFDCVIIQHEFGIFGGPDGVDILEFLDLCTTPTIVVLHTVLPQPSAAQRHIVEQIVGRAGATVVQTTSARDRLFAHHTVDRGKVAVIPHGAEANFPIAGAPEGDGRPTVLTWGLLGPGKGIEHGIRATAHLVERFPTLRYKIVGQTHPNVVAAQGERYRQSLQDLAWALGVGENVEFDALYRDFSTLRRVVRGADVILLPYDSRDQVTSGVLVEALAAAMPVVATAFPHAIECLSTGAGLVVPHQDPKAMARALGSILGDDVKRERMAQRAAAEAGALLWPRIGRQYAKLAVDVTAALAAA